MPPQICPVCSVFPLSISSSPEGSSGSYQAAGPALGLITEKGQWGIPVVVIESLLRFGLVCIVALTVVTGIQRGLEITGSVVRL